MNPRAGAGHVGFDDNEAAIDLLPPVHPRRILLADEAALGQADAVELCRIAFEPEDVSELRAPFADAEAQPMLEPAGCRTIDRPEPALAQRRQSRIGSLIPTGRPMHCKRWIALDPDRPSQAVDGQALDEVVGCL